MALVYEPGEALAFQQPFKVLTHDSLQLTNKNNGPVAFKVKTTAPKQYCVRPNAGRIEPGQSVQIQVSLQPMRDAIPEGFKCRDKFLVQSIQISPELESMPMTELWAMVEREAKSSISEKKLRVRYLPVESTAQPTTETSEKTPSSGDTKSPPAQQPQRVSPAGRALPGPSPLAKSVDNGNDSPGEESAEQSMYNEASAKTPMARQPAQYPEEKPQTASTRLFPDSSSAPSPADTTSYVSDYQNGTAVVTNGQASRAELEKANATIQELRRQLSEYKAQLEKVGSSKTMRPAYAQTSDTIDGLSMQSVAIVALMAFLVGYFFF
ncbi:phosphatidylinositol-binding protein scs2 [Coemansia sp. RSA 1822]|nr:phosphatidylinositol-binding protein scs2 [Coemansia sp. RSA 638]KAJ2123061.1 phosphatidylinositol-binding protein scs2 [Coemansia sp. RSA 720]KAJ2544416.1 phosphatidylinositol-binding protein scs2 [Coemansia sp. RSA 1853]KAJ2565399.1 phosphatidylinositol-binding protein scs2 [Coemansia sp. RSA 1822]